MKVYLSPLAEFKLETLLQYLEKEWGETSKNKFIVKFRSSIEAISSFPESNPKTDNLGGIYKSVITAQTSIYYRIKAGEVEIITIIDNRQDPNSVLEEIRRHFT